MRNTEDTARDIGKRNAKRAGLGDEPGFNAALQQAASHFELGRSDFAARASDTSAGDVIGASETTSLSPANHAGFLEALDNPPAPTHQLREAFERNKARVTSL